MTLRVWSVPQPMATEAAFAGFGDLDVELQRAVEATQVSRASWGGGLQAQSGVPGLLPAAQRMVPLFFVLVAALGLGSTVGHPGLVGLGHGHRLVAQLDLWIQSQRPREVQPRVPWTPIQSRRLGRGG